MSLTVGSLFSGIGGLELGLEWAGLEPKWQVEIEPYAKSILEKRWPHVKKYEDITQVDWRTVEPVDVVCGGFPCQDISSAGRRVGILAGGKSGLWREFVRCLFYIKPQYAVIENVAGLLSGSDKVPTCYCGAVGRDFLASDLDASAVANGTAEGVGVVCSSCGRAVGRGAGTPVLQSWMGRVLGDLAAIGYDAEWECLPAAAFGAPHLRYRVFIIGRRRGPAVENAAVECLEERCDRGITEGAYSQFGGPGQECIGTADLSDAMRQCSRDDRHDAEHGSGGRIADDAGSIRQDLADAPGRKSRKPTKRKGRKDSTGRSTD